MWRERERMCVCVCVYVCKREREREREVNVKLHRFMLYNKEQVKSTTVIVHEEVLTKGLQRS